MASVEVDMRTRSTSSVDDTPKPGEERPSTSGSAMAAAGERPPPSPSPDTAKCAICLGDLQDKCYSNTCIHEFCYGCLVKWSEVKPECPLCKSTFQSIYYNIRSINDFDEYIVPVNPAPPMPHLSLRINTTDSYAPPYGEVIISSRRGNGHDYSLPHHFRIGSRSGSSHTFTRDPRFISIMQIGFNAPRSMLMQPEAIDLTLQGTMIQNDNPFYSETPELFGHTLDLTNSIFSSSSSNPHFSGYQMRRRRYDRNQWVRPFDSALNPGSSVFPSVEYFQRTSSAIRRISTWLHRELTVLLSLRRSRTEMAHVYDVIVSLLQRYDIRSMEFREHIRSYFGQNTRHFQHEFFHFVLSGYSMEEYDRVAAYRESAQTLSPTLPNIGSSGCPPVVTIDSDEEMEPDQPVLTSQVNRPSASEFANQNSGVEIVISDDDDGPPTLYPSLSTRRRSPPLSPALNEEEYHMLSDMLEGSTSRLNRVERRGAQHRTLSPTTEEFLGALDPFDLSDPPTNHHSDLLDFDYDASRPHSNIDLNNLSSANRNSSSTRPSSSRNPSRNAVTTGSDPPSSLSEALMRFVDSNPLSSTTPRSARERASATIDMISLLQRRTAASRRDRSSNIHDPIDGRQNPRPSRYPTLFDEPQRPPRGSGRSGRSLDHRRTDHSMAWLGQVSENEERSDSRPSSTIHITDDNAVTEERVATQDPGSLTDATDSSNIAGCSSVQIRIFPPAMDLSSRPSVPSGSVSSYSRLLPSPSVMQSRSGISNFNCATVDTHNSLTSTEVVPSPHASNNATAPDEDECEFLGVQPVYKKPPLAVITLSSDDDDDGGIQERNRPKIEESQSQSTSTRNIFELLQEYAMYPSSLRSNSNSNAELSSLPTENMVERHLDAVASGFAYPMSMSSYPENQRPEQGREERLSTDSDGGLGGSDQVPSTSSLFRSYQVYPSSENNVYDPRTNSTRSSSDFDLLSILTSSSSSNDNKINNTKPTRAKSKKKESADPTEVNDKSNRKRKCDKPTKSSTVEETSIRKAGPSCIKLPKNKPEKKQTLSHKRKFKDKYKRLQSQSSSSDEEDQSSPSQECSVKSSVAAKKRSRSMASNLCLPVFTDSDTDEVECPPIKKKKTKKSKSKVKKSKCKSKSSKKEKKGKDAKEQTRIKSIDHSTEQETPSTSTGASLSTNSSKKLKSVVFKVDKSATTKKFTLLSDSSSDESDGVSKQGSEKRLRSVVTAPAGSTVSSSSCSSGTVFDSAHLSTSYNLTKSGNSSQGSSSNLDSSFCMASETIPCVPRKKLLRRWESEDDENHTKEPEQAPGHSENFFAYSSTSSDEDDDAKMQRNDSDDDDKDVGLKSGAKRSRLYLF